MRKKLKLPRYIRYIMVIVALVAMVGGGYQAVTSYLFPEATVQERTLYQYSQAVDASYSVNLKENTLYDESTLGEGGVYLVNYVKNIPTTFNYILDSTVDAVVEANYSIVAEVRGYVTENQEKKALWTKEFPLVTNKALKQEGTTITMDEQILVDYHAYNNYAKRIVEETEISSATEVIVRLVGEGVATIQGREIPVQLNSALVMPLNTNYFSIAKEVQEKVEDSQVEQVSVVLPVDMGKVAVNAGISVVGILILIGTIVLVEEPSKYDKEIKSRKQLITNHGSRLITLQGLKDIHLEEAYALKDVGDLIKVADEVEQPVCYYAPAGIEGEQLLYVENGTSIFIYHLPALEQEIAHSDTEQLKRKRKGKKKQVVQDVPTNELCSEEKSPTEG